MLLQLALDGLRLDLLASFLEYYGRVGTEFAEEVQRHFVSGRLLQVGQDTETRLGRTRMLIDIEVGVVRSLCSVSYRCGNSGGEGSCSDDGGWD